MSELAILESAITTVSTGHILWSSLDDFVDVVFIRARGHHMFTSLGAWFFATVLIKGNTELCSSVTRAS